MYIDICLEFTGEEVEAITEKIERESLKREDYPLLVRIIKALTYFSFSNEGKELSARRAQQIFGIKKRAAELLIKLANEKPIASKSKKSK